jgi:hypothetical protein
MSINPMLSIILGYDSSFLNKHRKINVGGASLLAGITSQAREKLLVEDQFILKS